MIAALLALLLVLMAVDWLQTLQIVQPGSGLREKFNPLLADALERVKSVRMREAVVHVHFAISLALFGSLALLLNLRSPVLAGFLLGWVAGWEALCVRHHWKLGLRP